MIYGISRKISAEKTGYNCIAVRKCRNSEKGSLFSSANRFIIEKKKEAMINENFKVLIGYDGSRFADAALDDLKNIGLPDNTEALILTVAEVWLPPHEEGEELNFITEGLRKKYEENMEILKSARETAARAAERVRNNFPDWKVTSEATYGSPAWEILFRAEDLMPDLIVVGAQGVFGLEQVLVGSVAQKIVTEARCSVRVARGKVEVDDSPKRLVIGYDGTPGADFTVETVCRRILPADTEVKVVIVKDKGVIRRSLEIDEEKIEETGKQVIQKLEACGLKASLSVNEGNPKYLLVEEAKNFNADCIFVGATKFNDPLTKYLLGSVSSAVVTRAHCSVEVVRPNNYPA